jgi:2',5'-phosphodiesterase
MASLATGGGDVGPVFVRFPDALAKKPSSIGKPTVSISFRALGVNITMTRDANEVVELSLKRAGLKLLKKLNGGGKKKKKKASKEGGATGAENPVSISLSLPGAPYKTHPHMEVWGASTCLVIRIENTEDIAESKLLKLNVSINAPRFLCFESHEFPIVGFPLLAHLELEFADIEADCRFTWASRGNVTGKDVEVWHGRVYVPTPADAGKLLVCKCVIRGQDDGATAECMFGPVAAGPPSTDGRSSGSVRFPPGSADRLPGHHRVMTYNILLQSLVADTHPSDPICGQGDYRKQLVVDEMLKSNANIISLQECAASLFQSYLEPVMRHAAGFRGIYRPKGLGSSEGCAIFFKTEEFDLIFDTAVSISDTLFQHQAPGWGRAKELYGVAMQKYTLPHICQIAVVEARSRGGTGQNRIVVCNTHLFYHNDAAFVRNIQCAVALEAAKEIMDTHGATTMVFSGDLNSTPETGVVEFLHKGWLPANHMEFSQEALALFRGVQKKLRGTSVGPSAPKRGNYPVQWVTKSGYKSVPEEAEGNLLFQHPFRFIPCFDALEPPLTLFSSVFVGTLDWLFFHGVERVRTLPLLPEASLAEHGPFPSSVFPSDHVSVVADFRVQGLSEESAS